MNYPLHRLPNQTTKLPDLILDGDEEFNWPLRLSNEQCEVLRKNGLTTLADRKRLSDIDDVSDVLMTLHYERERSEDRVGLGAIGTGEEPDDDFFRSVLQIWNAWDMQR